MFDLGSIVIYGTQGICKIDRIETKQIGKVFANYYVLKPIFNESTSVFVPIENKALTSKIKDVLTKTEAEALIDGASKISVVKSTDENQKREQYKELLNSCDRAGLLSLIKTICLERDLRRESGKKLNLFDEQTLRKAEQLLCNELAFVFGITPDEARNMIIF